jgi:hypothetical protein
MTDAGARPPDGSADSAALPRGGSPDQAITRLTHYAWSALFEWLVWRGGLRWPVAIANTLIIAVILLTHRHAPGDLASIINRRTS